MIQMNFTKQKQRMNFGLPGGRMAGRERLGAWNGHIYSAIFKIDNQHGPTVQGRGCSSVFCNNINGKIIEKL